MVFFNCHYMVFFNCHYMLQSLHLYAFVANGP